LVKVRRLHADLTQEQLAEMTGLRVRAIKAMEARVSADPRLRTYIKLARALGCRIEDLIEDEWNEPLPSDTARSIKRAVDEA
jgi:transcriptional regulator with XRE-family HTH domain